MVVRPMGGKLFGTAFREHVSELVILQRNYFVEDLLLCLGFDWGSLTVEMLFR